MIGHLLAMALTACDTRRNPAAKVVANQFAKTCNAFGDLTHSLFSSESGTAVSSCRINSKKVKRRKGRRHGKKHKQLQYESVYRYENR